MENVSIKTFTKDIRKELNYSLLFSFFINLLMLVSPIFMLQAYDRVLPSRSELTLLMLVILTVFLLLVLGMLDSLRYKLLALTASKLDQSLAPHVFRSILALNRLKPGSGGSLYIQELQNIKNFLSGSPVCVFFDAPWVPIFILCNFIIHPLLGSITFFAAISIFAIAFINEKVTRRITEDAQLTTNLSQQFAEQALSKSATIQALGMSNILEEKWLNSRKSASLFTDKSNIKTGLFSATTKAYRLILQTTILAAGCWLAIEQLITPGAMIAASIIMGRALAPVEQAIGSWRFFIKARMAYTKINQLLKAFPETERKITHEKPLGNLSVDKLIVLPPNSKKAILKGVSFQLLAGKSLMIGGHSASGKTTLLKTIAGIWTPYSGTIKLDGTDLNQWNPDDLGKALGYLPQSVDFLPGSIKDNIARFSNFSDNEVIDAAKFAGVHEIITELPEGYDTLLDSDSSILSSGQKQLIGLARAVFRHPQLILLDEPNAHLDQHGNQIFESLLAKLNAAKITTIVISHKTSVIKLVDFYMEIRSGQTAIFSPTNELKQYKQDALNG